MTKRKKIKNIIITLILITIIIISILLIFNKEKPKKTSEIKVNASENINNSLEAQLKNQTYYIEANLQRYLDYAKNNNLELAKIITDVNSNLDKTKYEDTTKTNIKDNYLMLVNKYYYLTENYTPSDLITLTAKYNKGVNSQMRKVAADAFMEMSDAATLDNITIKNASGYRSYQYQVNLYNKYVDRDGKKAADTYSARPGFSEHQTGLVSDINQIDNGFENTDAFRWLQEHAHEYGFILRFPKDKEDVTGYQYEPWHYRYVGEYVAEKMHDENLTLEEYYAYYVENKK